MASVDVVERTTVSVKSAFGYVAAVTFLGIVAFFTLFYTYQSRVTRLEEQIIFMSEKVEQQDKHIREIMDLRIKQIYFIDEKEIANKAKVIRKY